MRRRILASVGGKPLPYDAEVEYLQCDGNSYLRVFREIPKSATIVCDFDNQSGQEHRTVFQDVNATNYKTTGLYDGWNTAHRIVYSFSVEGVIHEPITGRFIVRFYPEKATITYDGIERNAIQKAGSRYDLNGLSLFYGYVFDGTMIASAGLKIYSLKAEDYIDLIPVRFTNENGVSEGAMYDRVSGQLFRNQGTGAFIVGPDVVSSRGGGTKCAIPQK